MISSLPKGFFGPFQLLVCCLVFVSSACAALPACLPAFPPARLPACLLDYSLAWTVSLSGILLYVFGLPESGLSLSLFGLFLFSPPCEWFSVELWTVFICFPFSQAPWLSLFVPNKFPFLLHLLSSAFGSSVWILTLCSISSVKMWPVPRDFFFCWKNKANSWRHLRTKIRWAATQQIIFLWAFL